VQFLAHKKHTASERKEPTSWWSLPNNRCWVRGTHRHTNSRCGNIKAGGTDDLL